MAAEPKTKPTDASVSDFIAAVENPVRRADAEVISAMLEAVSGEKPVMWGPSIIGYGSYRGSTGDWPIIGFSPRKANLVLYIMPGFEGSGALMARLGRHRTGASCLYINRLSDIDLEVLRALASASVEAMRARYGA